MSAGFCPKMSMSLHWFHRKPMVLWLVSVRWDRARQGSPFLPQPTMVSVPDMSLLSSVIAFEMFILDFELLIQAPFQVFVNILSDSKSLYNWKLCQQCKG